jgi:hypothetical protein
VPIEAKYLAPVMFCLTLVTASFLGGLTQQLDETNKLHGCLAALIIIGCLVRQRLRIARHISVT